MELDGLPPEDGAPLLDAAWVEATAVVQADEDAEVRLEAHGLMVAEMAEVDLGERLAALVPGAPIRLLLACGDDDVDPWIEGFVVSGRPDHLVVDGARSVIVPRHSIVAVSPLPRVLHQEPARGATWRSTMRAHLGEVVVVDTAPGRFAGRVTWVGRDHLSIDHDRSEVTIPWTAVISVAVD